MFGDYVNSAAYYLQKINICPENIGSTFIESSFELRPDFELYGHPKNYNRL